MYHVCIYVTSFGLQKFLKMATISDTPKTRQATTEYSETVKKAR